MPWRKLGSVIGVVVLLVFIGFALAVLAVRGWKYVEVSPPAPKMPEAAGFDASANVPSHFEVPIRMAVRDVERIANEATPTHFHPPDQGVSVGGFTNERLEIDLDRKPIKLTPSGGDRVSYLIPFSGTVTFHGKPHIGPANGPEIHVPLHLDGHVDGSVGVRINPDWSLTADTDPKISLTKAEIVAKAKLLGQEIKITINVQDKVQGAVNEHARAPAKQAFDKVLEKLQICPQAEAAWREMHLSKQVVDSPPVWLNVEPREIRVKPMSVQNELITCAIALSATTRAYVVKSAPAVPVGRLPGLVIDPNVSNRFEIVVPVQASVDELLAKAKESLEGKEFKAEGVDIAVSNVTAQIPGDRLVVGFDFVASQGIFSRGAKGRLYAVGEVRYDPATGVLSVSHLDYDIETKNIVVKVADWLFKPRILETAVDRAKLNVQPLLEKEKVQVNRYLVSLRPPRGVHPTLEVTKINLDDVRLTAGRVFLLLRCEGTSLLELTEGAIHP